ncbi:hypothetical protein ACWEK5_44035 [Rhodococcus koreensis]
MLFGPDLEHPTLEDIHLLGLQTARDAWLAPDAARHLTGITVPVDAGTT